MLRPAIRGAAGAGGRDDWIAAVDDCRRHTQHRPDAFVGQANTINAADTTLNVHFNSIAQFNGILEAYNASGLRYGFKYYPADSHGSVPLIAEYDALRFIFEGYQPDLFKSLENPAFIGEHFALMSKQLGYPLQPPEWMLDMLGQIALGRDSTKAMEFFKANVDRYPASSNAYRVLGDGWAGRGNPDQALAAYEKSIALNPGNQRAKDAIRKLKGGGRD